MHFGIPAYRLPRADLMREIARIEAMGVKIHLNRRVDDVRAEMTGGGFDAAFLAIGADVGKHVEIPARDAVRVLDAVTLLHDVTTGDAPLLGRRVVVYGGGNTAMDAARTVKRLGATEALIVYRRDRAHMPAHGFEADEAMEEGIKIKWLTTIKEIVGPELTVEVMELDASGRPQPTGRFETLARRRGRAGAWPADRKRLPAQRAGIAVRPRRHRRRRPRYDDRPSRPVRRRRCDRRRQTVTIAVGHGKRAARNIDAWLRKRPTRRRRKPRS